MPLTILPPKRWEDASDPVFDPIRHHAWFARLLKRKKHIAALDQALKDMRENGTSQKQACLNWFVATRELRDFIDYVAKTPCQMLNQEQAILDEAVLYYRASHGEKHLRHWIEKVATAKGFKPRPYLEKWEVDANYLPTILQ